MSADRCRSIFVIHAHLGHPAQETAGQVEPTVSPRQPLLLAGGKKCLGIDEMRVSISAQVNANKVVLSRLLHEPSVSKTWIHRPLSKDGFVPTPSSALSSAGGVQSDATMMISLKGHIVIRSLLQGHGLDFTYQDTESVEVDFKRLVFHGTQDDGLCPVVLQTDVEMVGEKPDHVVLDLTTAEEFVEASHSRVKGHNVLLSCRGGRVFDHAQHAPIGNMELLAHRGFLRCLIGLVR